MSDLLKQTTYHPESKMASGGGGGAAATEVVAITIDEPWIKSLEQRLLAECSLNCLQDNMTPTNLPTIFKVPKYIRSHDPKAYEPTMVSLGPYHHHKEHLRPMNQLKYYYLKKFLNRNQDISLADYIRMIREKEREPRSTYSEQVNMRRDNFIKMMLLDCCFVLEIISSIVGVLVAYAPTGMVDNKDTELEELVANPIISTPSSRKVLARDMLLIENQLSFFLLQLLFDRVRYTHGFRKLSLLVLLFFDSQTGWRVNTNFSGKNILHFLHLLHSSSAPAPDEQENNNEPTPPLPEYYDQMSMELFPRAVQLDEAGVLLKKKELHWKESFLCITFDKGKMEIPELRVEDGTNILFRNLIAFEECYYKYIKISRHLCMGVERNYFTAYASLMDCIIDTEADVNLLVQKEIILDKLGSGEEVASLFNGLCKGVVVHKRHSYLFKVFESMNTHWKNCFKKEKKEHWNSRIYRWKRKLKDDYFSSPWAGISLVGVFILFFLTMAQTIYTILSYYKK